MCSQVKKYYSLRKMTFVFLYTVYLSKYYKMSINCYRETKIYGKLTWILITLKFKMFLISHRVP